jgi:nucleoside-diphosphate kinase
LRHQTRDIPEKAFLAVTPSSSHSPPNAILIPPNPSNLRGSLNSGLAIGKTSFKLTQKGSLAMERTFLAIKPDGVQRQLVGTIVSRLELRGFQLVGLKLMQVSKDLAEAHYDEHKERPFFAGLVEFITSGPVVAMVWEGKGVVAAARKMIGKTNPLDSEPGTIRGDFGIDIGRNIIHGSDGVETATREIDLWFKPEELTSWSPATTAWLYE